MTSFDSLVNAYHAGRLGYANDIYNALIGYGLAPSHKVLDIGCGTGLASAPLIGNGYAVTGIDISEPMLAAAKADYPQGTWVHGRAEQLPFPDASFDVALSAQTFHHFDKEAALAQIVRVLRPRGIAAIWWKDLLGDDPVKQTRDAVASAMGFEPPVNTRAGFREFYAAPFSENALRVAPWSTITTLSRFLQYERSRKIVVDRFGSAREEYLGQLEERLRETFGAGDPLIPLSYMHYMYLAKK
ncbi:MAG TPA: class I SAM-dependent methyltransferase [Candidatus Aquilonibacter sp.]